MIRRILGIGVGLFFAFCMQADVLLKEYDRGIIVCTEYGDYQVSEPVLLELLHCPAMQRLKHIHQYGISHIARGKPDFSRFDHSVGVFVLLRRYGARLEEQIAGLLHDVSHTVFSHVGDYLFSHYFDRYSYQDDIHEWFLDTMGVTDILKKYSLEQCCSEQAKKRMRMLEQDKPDLCMDRIEYLLRGGLCENLLTQDDVLKILDDLYFENGQWVVSTVDSALTLGRTSLWLSEHIFGSSWNAFTYTHAAHALKRALDLKVLNKEDIHFSIDDVVWEKLKSANDAVINQALDCVEHHANYFSLGDEAQYTAHYKTKFLGVDPWIAVADGVERLSQLNKEYADEYNRVQRVIKRGWYLIETNKS